MNYSKPTFAIAAAASKMGGYAEIGQSMNTKQALLRPDPANPERLLQICGLVKCRDFLVDTYSYAVAGVSSQIYGFPFNGKKEDLSWDAVRLLVHFSKDADRKNFEEKFLWAVHQLEKKNGFELTTVHECDAPSSVVVIGDKRWLQNCLLFSLYCFFPRLMCYATPKEGNLREWLTEFGKTSASDAKYVASIAPETWDRIWESLKVLETPTFCGFEPTPQNVGTVHHNSGFISVLGWHSEISPSTAARGSHWQLLRERGLTMHPKTAAAAASKAKAVVA